MKKRSQKAYWIAQSSSGRTITMRQIRILSAKGTPQHHIVTGVTQGLGVEHYGVPDYEIGNTEEEAVHKWVKAQLEHVAHWSNEISTMALKAYQAATCVNEALRLLEATKAHRAERMD